MERRNNFRDFDGGAFNWFDLPKLFFRYVKPILAKLQTIFARHGELWRRCGCGRQVCRFDWDWRSVSNFFLSFAIVAIILPILTRVGSSLTETLSTPRYLPYRRRTSGILVKTLRKPGLVVRRSEMSVTAVNVPEMQVRGWAVFWPSPGLSNLTASMKGHQKA